MSVILEMSEMQLVHLDSSWLLRLGIVGQIYKSLSTWRLWVKWKSRFAFKDNGHGFVNELEGLSQQPCMQADLHMSNQLSRQVHILFLHFSPDKCQCTYKYKYRQLFCNKESAPGSGHDLVSTNIQRGRWETVRFPNPLATGSSWQLGNLTSGKQSS